MRRKVNMNVRKKSLLRAMAAGLGALLLAGAPAGAAVLDVTTEFKSDITNPGKNQFVNTTPVSGFCKERPTSCQAGEFSIIIPGLTATKRFEYASPDIKKHTWLSIDGRTKKVVLKNTRTGQEATVNFRWAFFGVKHESKSADHLYSAMENTGYNPSGDCSGRQGWGVPTRYEHGWGVNFKVATCYRKLNNNRGDGEVNINNFSIGYTLTTPNPLELASGDYVGELVYTVGDGQQVDFAADAYSDTEVRIRIKATVQHAFFYRFTGGSDSLNVSLTPPSGWGPWINGGMVPDRLSKEVPFTLSSSGGFKVWMRCEHAAGAGCGLMNKKSSEVVPLDVKMTIPGFNSGGKPVRSMLLNSSPAGHVIDLPGRFVTGLRSKLDFVVNRPQVEKMVKEPGSEWKGTVTLVFDSEVE